MKKRIVIIAALTSVLPMGQPLIIGTGAALTSAVVILNIPEEVNAGNNDFYYNRGVRKYDRGDYYGAIADYTKAIEINSRDADAFFNRGLAKEDLKDYYGAIADYTKAIEISPKADAYINRSLLKETMGDLYGACFDAKKAVNLGDRSSDNKRWIRENC